MTNRIFTSEVVFAEERQRIEQVKLGSNYRQFVNVLCVEAKENYFGQKLNSEKESTKPNTKCHSTTKQYKSNTDLKVCLAQIGLYGFALLVLSYFITLTYEI